MSFQDHFSQDSESYVAARPTYPADLFRFVSEVAPAVDRAWDCATGSGQAAVGLAHHFRRVEATDASEQQIANARPHARVRYAVQAAEKTDFAPDSFDAVCVAQALHWLDLGQFYPEAMRVLRREGVIVAWAYAWFAVEPGFDELFERTVLDEVATYWPPENALAWNGYRDVPFPFDRLDAPPHEMRLAWTFHQLMAYVRTWSGLRRCIAERGDAFFQRAQADLARSWGDPDRAQTIVMPLHVLAGRHSLR